MSQGATLGDALGRGEECFRRWCFRPGRWTVVVVWRNRKERRRLHSSQARDFPRPTLGPSQVMDSQAGACRGCAVPQLTLSLSNYSPSSASCVKTVIVMPE